MDSVRGAITWKTVQVRTSTSKEGQRDLCPTNFSLSCVRFKARMIMFLLESCTRQTEVRLNLKCQRRVLFHADALTCQTAVIRLRDIDPTVARRYRREA